MPYNTSFAFDSVAVIESLPAGDLRVGRDLFETTIAPVSIANPGVVSEMYEPLSGTDFLGCLATIASMAQQYGRSPVIHIAAHGNRHGIQLANGDFVTWQEIAPALTTVNQICRVNLLVVAAMCQGWHLSSVLRPTDRTPAFGVVGAHETLEAGALLDAMKRFYGALLGPGHDLRAALDEANGQRPFADWTFKMEGAELMLCRVFEHYVQEVATESTQVERVSRMVADVARIKNLDVLRTMRLRAELREAIDDHGRWFDLYRTRFLMLDLFPFNAPRFLLRYPDCQGDAA